LKKVRVPIGVIGIIYESRPEVTIDAAVLCLKSGNAVILRGGKEATHSNQALAAAMTAGIKAFGGDEHMAQLIPWIDRDAVMEMLQLSSLIDLIIPRGGEGLIHFVADHSKIPVIKHYKGVCHVYVDEFADHDMALQIIENAKCQRPGVCNAIEKVLIHKKIAETFVPNMAAMLTDRHVELRGDEEFCRMVPGTKIAEENDWYEEYLDLILTVGIVADLDTAITHINHYGSRHSDAIVSEHQPSCERFLNAVDSAVVYVNASTRFTDGGQFGMGAEIGISTDRLHARGPRGLVELTTYKYVVIGRGQVRS
jgi:glutamate-5-semialdehyde dehydrogenase